MARLIETDTVVEAVLAARSVREAADLLGVSTSTLYRKLREPAVAEALDEARRELLRTALVSMHAMLQKALDAIERCLDVGQPTSVQLAAARVLLENIFRSADALDLDARLRALESSQGTNRPALPLPFETKEGD